MKRWRFLLAWMLLLPVVAACSSTDASTGQAHLKIGVLPILDVLPLYVAEKEGYFKEQGLSVELTLFASAMERDSALQANQIDGEVNDLVSTALTNKDGVRIKAVRLAYQANPELAMIAILVPPSSKVRLARELKGVPVAISGNSVIEYATHQMMENAGVASADIKTMEITKIPARLEMLINGQIEAAALPEPMSSLAIQQGARVIADDRTGDISQSVVSFRQDVIDKNQGAIKRFLAAYEKGVDALAAEPTNYRDLMVEKAKLPDSLGQNFPVPVYPKAGLPSQREVSNVVDWMLQRGMLSHKLSYGDMVDGRMIPQ